MSLKSIVFLIAICFISFGIKAQDSESFYIYFDINSHKIENNYKHEFDKIDFSKIEKVEIYAYTDFLGSKEHNDKLSQKRANATKTFLTNLGIKSAKITTCQGNSIHKNSSFENRTDENDRGIKEHRKSEIIITFIIEEQTKTYTYQDTISFEKKFDNKKGHTDLANIKAEDLVKGNKFNIKNINFKGGTPFFLPSAEAPLMELLQLMRENPNLKIEIIGHICCQDESEADGYDYSNDTYTLSLNRAEAVYIFLRKGGIEASRMTYKGVAATQKLYPLEQDSWEQGQNRRVEIHVLEN
ncbi:MAG TPA: OmpA family protein [Bacteroidales bacterium]|nr:OmpA family protein [Bacteroidales bacterium]HPL03648.1 OmpA family protein [Bacteroidales bacterium]